MPNEDPNVGSCMHGFLNFLRAGFLAFSGTWGVGSIARVFEDFGYGRFSFGENSMRCGTSVFD